VWFSEAFSPDFGAFEQPFLSWCGSLKKNGGCRAKGYITSEQARAHCFFEHLSGGVFEQAKWSAQLDLMVITRKRLVYMHSLCLLRMHFDQWQLTCTKGSKRSEV
jgi:hypothetical protein